MMNDLLLFYWRVNWLIALGYPREDAYQEAMEMTLGVI